jgi:hypothetical protein
MVADIDDFFKTEMSQIDLDSQQVQGDLGLADFILSEVFYDTLVLKMVDMDEGLKKQGNFYMAAKADVKAWRRGVIKMVGPNVKLYKVGDMVIFPGVKGLETGEIHIRNEKGEVEYIKNGHFLSENRIFGKVEELTEGQQVVIE